MKYQLKMRAKKYFKILIFHLLLTFRRTILFLSKIFALLFCFGSSLFFIFKDMQVVQLVGKLFIITFAIIFTLIYWFYDELIFYFQPEDKNVILYKWFNILNFSLLDYAYLNAYFIIPS